MEVLATEDPAAVLDEAGAILAADPVRANVVLTLLHRRMAHPEAGRYWVVGGYGVVFQSPLSFPATITPMGDEAVGAAVDAVVGGSVVLLGVSGEASTAARFAGQWTERTRSAAQPVQGERIYEVEAVVGPASVGGARRTAAADDRDLLIEWVRAFGEEAGMPGEARAVVAYRLPRGELQVWDDGGPRSFLGLSPPTAGVVRIGPVYTPPDQRGRGYATALVAATSAGALADGHRCILYTDLANPTSNAIYRALGYRAVAEGLRYRFS